MNFIDQLTLSNTHNKSMLCVGLDPEPKRFPLKWRGDERKIFDFCAEIVNATADLVMAFKPQIAYFSSHRAEAQLERLIQHIREVAPHVPVVLDAKRGDKIIYHHLNRPEFALFGRTLRFKISPKKWQLNTHKHLRWLRQVMPGWHRRECDFRDWYIALVENFPAVTGAEARARYIQALRCVESIKGYREIRNPKMDAARQQAEQLLAPTTAPVTQSTPLPAATGKLRIDR